VPVRYGNAHANIVPYQLFKAADREFIIACGNDTQFIQLCRSIGLPELPNDVRFTRNADRVKHRDEVIEILSKHFLSKTADEWVSAIYAAKVPVGVINNLEQAFNEPQVIAREMLVEMQHPQRKKLTVVGSPIKLSRTPVEYRNAPPLLGEHTQTILGRIISPAKLDELKAKGVIG
jgi:crotonobetainyl-CoA:carnitine CoA-transferase CaiB-like acyl-CoA transferase